jgi:hypothetical protein
LTDALQTLEDTKAQIAALKEQAREQMQALLKHGISTVWEEYGDIVAEFGWDQYTPYFNDGEPCEFGRGEIYIIGTQEPQDTGAFYGGFRNAVKWGEAGVFGDYSGVGKVSKERGWGDNAKRNPDYDPRYAEAKDYIHGLVDALDNDILYDLFGDHVTVQIRPDGIETEHCVHD